MRNREVIKRFVQNGAKNATGSHMYYWPSQNILVNYSTALGQRLPDGRVLVNMTSYSRTTSGHQSTLCSELSRAGIEPIMLDEIRRNETNLAQYMDTHLYVPHDVRESRRREAWRVNQLAKQWQGITRAFKDKQFLIFVFADDSCVKYNLTTGELINMKGKTANSLAQVFRGQILSDVIEMFPDDATRNYLRHVHEQTRRSRIVENNVSTFLKNLGAYANLEQYFAAGITELDGKINYSLSEVPRGLIEMARNRGLKVSNRAVEQYKRYGEILQNIARMEFASLEADSLLSLVLNSTFPDFNSLLDNHNYNYASLVRYLDGLHAANPSPLSSLLGRLNDYANMMSALSQRFDKYPKKLEEAHDVAVRNYNAFKQEHSEELFASRYDPRLEASFRQYEVIAPRQVQDIKDEGVELHHCVASYVDRVIKGETNILFLRNKKEPSQSLVTLEVRDGKVTQARGKYNRMPTEQEQEAITRYENKLRKERVA